jgi:hypothetical protein
MLPQMSGKSRGGDIRLENADAWAAARELEVYVKVSLHLL